MWTPLLNGCITVVDGCSSIRQPVASVLWQIPVGGSQAYPTYVAHRSRVHRRRLAARKSARIYRKCDRTLYGAAGGNAASALLGQPDAFQERGKRPASSASVTFLSVPSLQNLESECPYGNDRTTAHSTSFPTTSAENIKSYRAQINGVNEAVNIERGVISASKCGGDGDVTWRNSDLSTMLRCKDKSLRSRNK